MIAIYALTENQTISLYLDGVFTARANDSLTVVKDQHERQAIHVEDPSADAEVYFLSSSSNGARTDDRSWRCSNEYHEGWFLPNFSDTSWPRPRVGAGSTFFISPDAKWIGYSLAKSNRIFCRWKTTEGKRIFVHGHPPGSRSVGIEKKRAGDQRGLEVKQKTTWREPRIGYQINFFIAVASAYTNMS